ncbi:MAG: hypothetical protein E5X68_07400 [Mesorhizobium sp.]|nr:MAG: hypothetical protein EOQ84_02210 [Mesorhizobium sp.]RWL28881.1 MAG: hypothetical protein EOR58_11505 [Mesorhizobium sp.]RWL30826.1 MAG: hypothetical protein EOR63_14995 [Mesorhizobium sp.]RWL37403.1 MAG: hypothetical protein EOR59_17995 [Mesorhizobium sp.]RWL53832.1 MAG: hypothetical protein EOR61_15795 [Mesorhizobium sp.]
MNTKSPGDGAQIFTNPSIFGSSQNRGVLIPICSRSESVTFRESEAILPAGGLAAAWARDGAVFF